MRGFRKLALGATMLAVVLAACSSGGGSKPTIKVGSDGFDEARVMAEIYAQALEANGYTVNRDGIGLKGRPVSTPSRAIAAPQRRAPKAARCRQR